MKINQNLSTFTPQQKKITPKNLENGVTDKVVLGETKDDTLLMGESLKSMKAGDEFENWFAETLAEGIEEGINHMAKVSKYTNTGKLIGAGIGLAAGITGAACGLGGPAGFVVLPLIGGGGGLFLGGQIGKAMANR